MKRLLLFLLILPLPLSAQLAPPDTCLVEGYIYGPDLQRAAGEKVYVLKTIAPGFLTTLVKGEFEADATGWIRMTLFRNSRAWLYGRKVNGLERSGGVELVIPDAATARIETLVPPATLSPTYVVAVPLPPNHGDSLHVVDSLARVALDSASAARQELLDQVAQLQAQLDTAGAATRAVIEADIAALYGQAATLSGQIAVLAARVDTVGAASRAALEADVAELVTENAAQDIAIADAGKWVQYDAVGTYKVAAPKWTDAPGDTTKMKIDNAGNEHLTGTLTVGGNIDLVSGGGNVNLAQTARINLRTTTSYLGYEGYRNVSGAEIPWQFGGPVLWYNSNGNMRLHSHGAWAWNSPSVTNFGANFGGNVWVNSDSTLFANNIRPATGAEIFFGGSQLDGLSLDNVSGVGMVNTAAIYNRTKGYGRPYISFNDFDMDLRTTGGSILRVRETSGGGGDSAVQIGELAAMRGLHAYGGAKFEGDVSAKSLTVGAWSSNGAYWTLNGNVGYGLQGTNMNMRGFWGITLYTGSSLVNFATAGSLGAYFPYRVKIGDASYPVNALEVNGNIKQHKDSTSDVGPVNTPRIVIDTLGPIQSDTLVYYFIGEKAPLSYQPLALAHGSRTYRYTRANLIGTTHIMQAVADTANGVQISRIEFNVGGTHHLLAGQSTGRTYGTAYRTFSGYTPNAQVTEHFNISGTLSGIMVRGVPWSPGARMILEWYNPGQAQHCDFEITVHYTMPSPTSSVQPVFLKI